MYVNNVHVCKQCTCQFNVQQNTTALRLKLSFKLGTNQSHKLI